MKIFSDKHVLKKHFFLREFALPSFFKTVFVLLVKRKHRLKVMHLPFVFSKQRINLFITRFYNTETVYVICRFSCDVRNDTNEEKVKATRKIM